MEGLFVPIAFFLTIFAILYVYYTTRSRERLALVEKGADASLFKVPDSKYTLLKWGIFLIALAVGVISGFALSNVVNEVVAFFTAILLFGGIGLIVAYWITSKLTGKE
jgi:preprotein translocase subunit SecD